MFEPFDIPVSNETYHVVGYRTTRDQTAFVHHYVVSGCTNSTADQARAAAASSTAFLAVAPSRGVQVTSCSASLLVLSQPGRPGCYENIRREGSPRGSGAPPPLMIGSIRRRTAA